VQPIHLYDSRSRLVPRGALVALGLGFLTLAVALVLGGAMNIEQQVMSLVILDVLLLTTVVAFYDITNSVVLWLFALTTITRYTQLNLPGIPDMSGPRFMLVLMWAVFFVEFALRRRRPLPLGPIELCMIIFLGVNLVSMVQHENLVHTVARASPITAFMNFVVFPFSVYYLVRNSSANDRGTRKLLAAFAVLQIYLALTGIFEHFRLAWLVFPPDILDPKAGDGRWYGVRIRGPYLHSPIYGAAMGMGFFLLLHYFNHVRSRLRWLMLVGIAATPLACFYTLTRQVWIGLALPMLLGAGFSRRHRVMLLILMLATCAVLVMVDLSAIIDPKVAKSRATNEATGQARIAHYVVGTQMFLDKPLFGHGIEMWDQGNLPHAQPELRVVVRNDRHELGAKRPCPQYVLAHRGRARVGRLDPLHCDVHADHPREPGPLPPIAALRSLRAGAGAHLLAGVDRVPHLHQFRGPELG